MAVATADRRVGQEDTGVARAAGLGALWGVVAAIVMAMYAMIAGATYLGTGFFTPMYHIASAVIEPNAMMASMESAMSGQTNFYFALGPAVVGMMVHLMTGALYGVIFALIARGLKLAGAAAVVAGIVYGIAVLLFSSFVGLPIAAAVLGGGDPISSMPQMVGWTTFTIEHVMFGMVLGLAWLAARRSGRVGEAVSR